MISALRGAGPQGGDVPRSQGEITVAFGVVAQGADQRRALPFDLPRRPA